MISRPQTAARATIERTVADHRAVTRALNSRSEAWQRLDLSMAQMKAVFVLHDLGPLTIGGLAGRLGVGLPATSLLADRLVAGGLAERGRGEDSEDRRRTVLRLSEPGEALAVRLRQGSSQLLASWLEQLSEPDLESLARGLRALAEVASRSPEPVHG
ncbi:MarR family transcriptional regulator [Candidatus Nephthysia bennettiae]|uniref:MarR family transcriptional regulator n=1 Tax=Candidatus Nephthysia bennettiae TaxID=3127016 RepID=A0A934KBM0_9BACT|nr:MarR family transcriptional regulator [Candidatus Dormibacteraeota bacterium]MBJ7613470.1 MarR family transcriptional regulator [Candidatus Dormibacteraeota bacterium]